MRNYSLGLTSDNNVSLYLHVYIQGSARLPLLCMYNTSVHTAMYEQAAHVGRLFARLVKGLEACDDAGTRQYPLGAWANDIASTVTDGLNSRPLLSAGGYFCAHAGRSLDM